MLYHALIVLLAVPWFPNRWVVVIHKVHNFNIFPQGVGASRHSPTGRSYELDRSAIAADIKKSETIGVLPLTIGQDTEASKYRGVQTLDWGSDTTLTRPGIAVAKTTVTTVV